MKEEKLKVLSLFSGIGAFEKALTNLNIDYELVGFSEIDKWAIKSYCAIHNISEDLNLGDISKIKNEDMPSADLVTYGFPCQDISVAGLQKGIKEGTRSGLLYEAERVIKTVKPKYAIAENVKNLVGKKHKNDFDELLKRLDEYGYNNYWQVLNAKDYGIPQNRERVFIVSIRKDIDNKRFTFPESFELKLKLKDLLEDKVEDKYYIDNDRTSILLSNLKDKEMSPGGINVSKQGKVYNGSTEVASCLLARDYKGLGNQSMTTVAESMIVASRGRNPNNPSDRTTGNPTEQRLEPNSQGITNTLTTVQKDNLVLEKIVCEQRTDEGLRFFKGGVVGTLRTIDAGGDKRVIEKASNEPLLVGGIGEKNFGKQYRQGNRVYDSNAVAMCLLSQPVGNTGGNSYLYTVEDKQTSNDLKLFTNLEGGKWDKIHESARRVYDEEGIEPTIPTCGGGNIEPKVQTNYKIRKLTPLECWRLMGFADENYNKARQALESKFYNGKDRSNSQMYKQAGNSICVNVLEAIFKELFKEKINE